MDGRDRDFGFWWAGIEAGLRAMGREPIIGLKRLVLPVSYWRLAEFRYVAKQLRELPPAASVLDLGSPKDLAAFLALRRHFEMRAVDILPEAVQLSERFATALGIAGSGPGRVLSQVVDGRRLPYADASFDAAFSVSVIEHIPDEGDSLALGELVRVVRPGGLIVLTTPYAPQYRETFVEADVYERKREQGERVFFERHYDDLALHRRLLDTVPARCVDLQLWGEGALRGERLLAAAGPLRAALSPLEPMLAHFGLRQIRQASDGFPMAAFLTLQKS